MPRTSKSISVGKTSLQTKVITEVSSGAIYQQTNRTFNSGNFSETRVTTNTSNFRDYRRGVGGVGRDDLPINPFTYIRQDVSLLNGRYRRWDGGYLEDFKGNLSGFIGTTPDFDTGPSDTLLNAFDGEVVNSSLLRVKDQKVNLGVVFAERKRTADLILGTAKQISDSIHFLKRGNISGAASALGVKPRKFNGTKKSMSSRWLELQYGWKPLLHDVYGAAEALARLQDRPNVTRLSFSKTHRWGSQDPVTFEGCKGVRTTKGKYTRKVVYYFATQSQVHQDLASLGIYNPLSIAWEILPYSFIVDWFIPIGNFIDSLDATIGLSFQKGSSTSFKKWRSTISFNRAVGKPGGPSSKAECDAKASYDYVKCVRTSLSSFPLPHLPSFDLRITPTRAANALALIFQRTK